jgi:hypothetical protein
MPDLTDFDYDTLLAVMQADMPKLWREIFPRILAQLEGIGRWRRADRTIRVNFFSLELSDGLISVRS